MKFARITVDPQQMVATVVGMVADGTTAAEILVAYPDLRDEDIHEALHYAAAAVRERGLPLAAP